MGVLGYLTIGLSIVWALPSIRDIAKRRSRAPSAQKDRGSLLVVLIVNCLSVGSAVFIKVAPSAVGRIGAITSFSPYTGFFGCALMVVGMVVRRAAIATLKSQFTVDVNVDNSYKLIDKGLYSAVRHPAYLGGQITMLGFGLALENWVAVLVLVVPTLAAHLYRIAVEERALVAHFGSSYVDYMKRTKRLIPGVF